MRILHVFDHSIPLQSGYTFRSLSLLTEQRRLGWETHHLTTPRHTEPYQAEETVDGWTFHRTPPVSGPGLPVLRERAEMAATEARLTEIIPDIKPDILHAHSPVFERDPRHPRRAETWHSRQLRGARLLGRRRRQPWVDHRGQPALPADPRPGNLRPETGGFRDHDLRRACAAILSPAGFRKTA